MINKQFSLFQIVNVAYRPNQLFSHTRTTLQTISYQIENTIIHEQLKTRIFVGFQQLSFFLPHINRYRQMARVSNGIWVFGIPDVENLPDIPSLHYIYLTREHRLAEEWFLIVDAPQYFSALLAQDLTKLTVPNEKRQFRGIWTFDESIVYNAQTAISEALALAPTAKYPRNYLHQMTQVSMTMSTLLGRLEERNQALKQAQQLREDLTQMLVHDMRNPLSVVISSLRMLQTYGDSIDLSTQDEWLRRAIDNGETLNHMMEDLLDVAKLEEGQMELKKKPLKPAKLFSKVVDMLGSSASDNDKKLIISLSDNLPLVLGEEDKISRVLQNLVSNAIKYANSIIELTAKIKNTSVEFIVTDDGYGIPPEALDKVFTKFAQVGGAKQKYGIGLGLTFCRLMIEAHGGKIWVESQLEQGASFHFTLLIA